MCDHLTVRIQASVQQWLTIKHMDDQALAQRIRDDRIDILIDLCGHNAGNRMGAMALQPAPLLVKWVRDLINTTAWMPSITCLPIASRSHEGDSMRSCFLEAIDNRPMMLISRPI